MGDDISYQCWICPYCFDDHRPIHGVCKIDDLKEVIDRLRNAIEVFENRRRLAHSLRNESPQITAFMSAVGSEMDKILVYKRVIS